MEMYVCRKRLKLTTLLNLEILQLCDGKFVSFVFACLLLSIPVSESVMDSRAFTGWIPTITLEAILETVFIQ